MTENVNLLRRALLQGGAGLALSSLAVHGAAQPWPARPIRLLTGYAPGGSSDITARAISAPLARLLGQPVVVDNKPGASSALAAAEVAHAAPDGYTLGLLDNAPMTIVPSLRNPGYDPLTSFTSISMVTQMPQVLVAAPTLPANSVRDLIELMKKQPGKMNYGSGGSGSVGHLCAELLKSRSQTVAVHVPYRGAAPVVTALMSGEIQFAFLTYTGTAAFLKSGNLKALAVSSTTRLPTLPQVPTIAETALPGFDAPGWFALMAPAGLPAGIVATLNKALADTMKLPAILSRMEELGQIIAAGKVDPKQTIPTELGQWKRLITERKIVVDG
ncbi:Bug family tripartite tricarboxylate transporter substrate binding protein [Cupriavidus lacunae]|uniref:Tripartite tricarboxylate transporter substrate binding protein n=1 Tax=Cupriavidus lacunae TaxID=2666307 RepID=A0A370NJE6_9BURK|nr:tripartite tricarboxylate transporter substrate binding protein [Cupriavidus lacunae]RDK05710.1 tripartite tricarboxylate transporter substrate binding protein [Cupriavidus lacunae]